MVKKMVRLALSTEYSRQVIRRTDISAKVLGEQGARQFKVVFEGAQKALRATFGMQMVELPAKEKVTVSQRRGEFFFFFSIHFFHFQIETNVLLQLPKRSKSPLRAIKLGS